jgi:glycosyltransferase involved in cell wall biosynthesis
MTPQDASRNARKVLLVGPKPPPHGGMSVQAGLLEAQLKGEGVSVVLLTTHPRLPDALSWFERARGLRSFLRSAVLCYQLWRELASADVVHVLGCSWVPFFFIVCPVVLVCRLRGKRIILNYHGGQADEFLRYYRRFATPIFRMADVVTVPSGFLVEIIARRTAVQAQIVPNIVALNSFRYRDRVPFRPRILTTRHLEKLYDVETVLRAFRRIQQVHPEATLQIAGTGTQENYLRALAARWDLKHVRFLGQVPYQSLSAFYDQCDILLNASLADNFPGSLLEAAAAGLVVISSNVGGIPFIFEHGTNSLLVAPGDSEGLASAALRVLGEPGLGLRLTRNALERCRCCDWKQVRKALYHAYGFDLRRDPNESSDSVEREGEPTTNGVSFQCCDHGNAVRLKGI